MIAHPCRPAIYVNNAEKCRSFSRPEKTNPGEETSPGSYTKIEQEDNFYLSKECAKEKGSAQLRSF